MDIPKRGSLKELSFSDILKFLQREKATGTIIIKGHALVKKIYIKRGDVIYASSSLDDERLGEMLIKAGMISKEQYDISVDILKRTGKKQGAIFVELGILTPKQLFEGLKFQVREIIYSIFGLRDAEYEFLEGELPDDEVIGLRINISDLIKEGIKRASEKEVIINEEERELKRKAEELYQRLKDMNAADILQVTERSSPGEIKRNYYRLAKEYHPDRAFNSKDKELKEKLTYIFDAIAKAYDELKDDDRRSEFFKRIVRPKEVESRADLNEQFRRGIEEYKKGNYWGASDIFRWITRLNPKSVKAWYYLSQSLSNIPGRLKDAEASLLEAIKLDPFRAEHYASLGNIYLKAGLKKRAKRQFEKALNIDSALEEAIKGLEQIKAMPED
ncbi:MAG: DUF4388 domain-containing protein [Thermodesulfovibrionales bacterium]